MQQPATPVGQLGFTVGAVGIALLVAVVVAQRKRIAEEQGKRKSTGGMVYRRGTFRSGSVVEGLLHE